MSLMAHPKELCFKSQVVKNVQVKAHWRRMKMRLRNSKITLLVAYITTYNTLCIA